MKVRSTSNLVVLGIVIVGVLCLGAPGFAVDKMVTSQEEVVASSLRAYVAHGLQIQPAAVTVRIMSSLDGLAISPRATISHIGLGSPLGRVTFVIGLARVQAQVEAVKDVAVASRFLRRNQLLEEADVAMASVRMTRPDSRYMANPDLAVGQRVTRSVPARVPLTEEALGKPYAIRQGARITIQYVQGPLKVLALGIAKEDGVAGMSIRVSNLDSKKEISAKVVDGETVQVGP
jgi:flagella basal body P-ring formation protein FlgA